MDLSKVLVAVKGDKADEEAIQVACQLLSPKGTLFILYVIEVERKYPVDAEVTAATARGESVLQHMEEVARRHKREYKAELLQARRAGCAVVQEAVEREVEAIVLGVPYQERYGSFFLGDTVPYVLKHAPCNVVLWRGAVAGVERANGQGRPAKTQRSGTTLRFW